MRSLERLKLIAYTKKDFKLVAVESSRKPNFLTNKLKSTMYTNLNLRHSFANSIHNITTKLNSSHFMMNKQHKVAKILSFFINFLVHLFTLKFFFLCIFNDILSLERVSLQCIWHNSVILTNTFAKNTSIKLLIQNCLGLCLIHFYFWVLLLEQIFAQMSFVEL